MFHCAFTILLKSHVGLTCGFVWHERLVIKAKNLSDIVEIWMLNNKGPLCVVKSVVEVGDAHLHTPIRNIV